MCKNSSLLLIFFTVVLLVVFAYTNILIFYGTRGGALRYPSITYDNVMEKPHSNLVQIILTGDVMLGRTVMIKSRELGDASYPFRKVADTLSAADLVFINLENPIINDCPVHTEGYTFCAGKDMLEGLLFSGVDVVSLENNHSLNYGTGGKQETVKLLKDGGIETTHDGELVVKDVKGTKYGFIGFDFVSKMPVNDDWSFVEIADTRVDVLIVGVHWGNEYKSVANELQQSWAAKLVESGADAVVGHHPHWVQNIEYINGVPVYYSLGNFVFDQMWSEETKKGLLVKLMFDGTKLVSEEMLPTYISNWVQPELVNNQSIKQVSPNE